MSTEQRRWILGGGLASGKSQVRILLAEVGISTLDADTVGHEVLEPERPAFAEVRQRWPDVVVDGQIDRGALAKIVFSDPEALAELEAITHPYIFDTIRHRVEEIEGPVVVEMPVVGERLGEDWSRLVVDARDDVKVERAISRGMDEKDARARLASQPRRDEWLAIADLVIPNHGSLADLEDSVKRVTTRL